MPYQEFQFEAIGTRWSIALPTSTEAKTSTDLQRAVMDRIESFDKQYSRFRTDSLVSRMNTKAATYQLPDDAKPLFDLYHTLYILTDGAVTPLIGRTLESAGYDARYSLQPKKLVTVPAWAETMDYHFPELKLHQPALLDLGAAGKGYLADIIGGVLEKLGTLDYIIDAGGDIVHRSPNRKSIDVALEHPTDPEQAIGVAHLGNGSLCGSGINRRKWGSFHHIINPRTLRPQSGIAALWVTAASGLVADGLATALFFCSPERLLEHFDFEYALVRDDHSLERSAGFPGDFFTD